MEENTAEFEAGPTDEPVTTGALQVLDGTAITGGASLSTPSGPAEQTTGEN